MKIIQHQYYWGYIVIGGTVLFTLSLWIFSLWMYGAWYEDRFKYVAKVGSMSATMLMCWAFILSVRLRTVNRLFGGLDKVYMAHRHVGEAAALLIFLHPIFLAVHLWPDGKAFARFFWFSDDWVRNSGIVAILLLVLLVILSIWRPMKYHRWKLTHNFFGVVLLLVIYHATIARAEIYTLPPLRAWFAVWLAAGVISYLYIRLLYRFFGPLYTYRVAKTEKAGDVLELYLQPVNPRRRLRHRPGQFLFISFDTPKLSSEPHPFSISSSPTDEVIRLSIKELGDWTSQLDSLNGGEIAHLWGPYGQFSDRVAEASDRDAVMIAGGIGITPFLGMISDPAFIERRQARTWLIYSVVKRQEAYRNDQINELQISSDKFTYVLHSSDESGYLDADKLKEHTGALGSKCFYLCGPKPMMDSLTEQLLEAGVPLSQIYKEDFSAI